MYIRINWFINILMLCFVIYFELFHCFIFAPLLNLLFSYWLLCRLMMHFRKRYVRFTLILVIIFFYFYFISAELHEPSPVYLSCIILQNGAWLLPARNMSYGKKDLENQMTRTTNDTKLTFTLAIHGMHAAVFTFYCASINMYHNLLEANNC